MAKTKKAPDDGIQPVVIDGRTFVHEGNMSFKQDIFVYDLINKMGLDEIDIRGMQGKQIDQVAKKLVIDAYRTGNLFTLLGAMFRDKDADPGDWTEETAEETAQLFMNVREKKAKDAIEKNLVLVLLSFFASGLSSMETSQNSSVSLEPKVPGLNTEDTSTSESGSPSSAKLAEAIRIANERSRGGRSVKDS